jgi:gamma-glutamylcyclotransferase (GGCT)/AIG2-like uncharacterized protein YtfP
MTWLNYLAYGSNLHPQRLMERVPSAELTGALTLTGYRLTFHKRGQDNSGKCNLFLTHDQNDQVHCALYRMAMDHKPLLDQFEGLGYRDTEIQVQHNDELIQCFVYIAESSHIDDSQKPYSWYKDIVLLGCEYHGLPEAYLSHIHQVESSKDPDPQRRDTHQELIARLRTANQVLKSD